MINATVKADSFGRTVESTTEAGCSVNSLERARTRIMQVARVEVDGLTESAWNGLSEVFNFLKKELRC